MWQALLFRRSFKPSQVLPRCLETVSSLVGSGCDGPGRSVVEPRRHRSICVRGCRCDRSPISVQCGIGGQTPPCLSPEKKSVSGRREKRSLAHPQRKFTSSGTAAIRYGETAIANFCKGISPLTQRGSRGHAWFFNTSGGGLAVGITPLLGSRRGRQADP